MKCGVYKKKPLDIDLDDALLSPYMENILPRWNTISGSVGFTTILNTIERDIKRLVEDAGKDIRSGPEIIVKQNEVSERARATVMDHMDEAKKTFLEKKRIVGRDLSNKALQKNLQRAYRIALRLHGKDSLRRRKVSLWSECYTQAH